MSDFDVTFGSLDDKLLDLETRVRDLGLSPRLRDEYFDKDKDKSTVTFDKYSDYFNLLTEFKSLIAKSKVQLDLISGLIESSLDKLMALRDQYNPPYDSYWFSSCKDLGKVNLNENLNLRNLLINLIGSDNLDKLTNIYVDYSRFYLSVRFGIVGTPKSIIIELPGNIDIFSKLNRFDELKDSIDLSYFTEDSVNKYIPEFKIHFIPGLGESVITSLSNLDRFDEFKNKLIKLIESDINSKIPAKPELTKDISYEEFIDWKINRTANNNIRYNGESL